MRELVLLLLIAPLASAEWFVIGLRAGAPLTEIFETSPRFGLNTSTTAFTIGPTAELRLPLGLGVEVDALYKRSEVDDPSGAQRTANSWEFPLLAKYRLPGPGLRPYVAGGVSFRKVSDLADFVRGLETSTKGFVLGGGLEIKIPKVYLQPELRYTRWERGLTGETNNALTYNRNQVDFLFGVVF